MNKTNKGKIKITKIVRYPTLVDQIYEALKKSIEEGSIPGSMLPTEKELAETFDVGRDTIRSAVDRLVDESVLRRIQGKGTFVGTLPFHKTSLPIKNKCIGILFYKPTDMFRGNSFYGTILNAIVSKALNAGYVPMLFSTSEHPKRDERFFQMCRQGYMTGVAILGITFQDTIREVADIGIPSVLIDHWSEDGIMDSIEPESVNAAIDTVKELYKLGHRQIGYIAWSRHDLNPYRFTGYKAGLKAVGLPYDDSIVIESEALPEELRQAARKLLSEKKRPSAIVCNDTLFAEYLIQEAKSMGISIPSELSVTGFGGLSESKISTIEVNNRKLGEIAFRRLMARMKDPDLPYEKLFVPSKLIRNKTLAHGPYKQQKREKVTV